MDDFHDAKEEPPAEQEDRLNLDDPTWWKRNQEPSGPLTPMTPMTYSFLAGEQRDAFNFPSTPQNEEIVEKAATASNSPEGSTSESTSKRTLCVKDLLVVDDSSPQKTAESYKPKAHLGWASFGEAISKPPKQSPPPEDPPPLKRKVYVVRSKPREDKPPVKTSQILEDPKPEKVRKLPVIGKSPKCSESSDDNREEEDDEDVIVDVVGIDNEEKTQKKPATSSSSSGKPPDLPPQRPLNTRFESQRQRKDFYNTRRSYESDDDESLRRKVSRLVSQSVSPPPQLERQMSGTSDGDLEAVVEEEDEKDDAILNDDVVEKKFGLEHNPAQLLKTKVSSTALAVFPQSKSIMEHKKAAIELTKHAVIKRVPAPKGNTKNMTVAPKSVQVPAYAEKAPITLYSKMKPATIAFPRDNRVGCFRCRERPSVDMSSFKFLEDTNVVAVRAHLCDQTRVMIARTALWNREYARRLGDKAHGTLWQKPDEVTAQMTGFCSATVRRCIDIANMSIVPKCADRIGVSKNELSSLQNAFGNEKFCGQPMRTPHVLSQYYSVKAGAAQQNSENSGNATKSSNFSSFSGQAPPRLAVKRIEKEDEDAKKHDPISNQNTPSTSSAPCTSSSSVPPLRKTVLSWSSIQSSSPRILRPPAVPRTAVIPVMKEPSGAIVHRKRGRPRKERTEEEERTVRTYTRRLRSNQKKEAEEIVKETLEALLEKITAREN